MTFERACTVVLADDDDDFVCLATHTLLRAGYSVLSVTNGADLVTQTRAQLTEAPPDSLVVIADMDMPGLTGLEAATHLGVRETKLPFLLITAEYSAELSREAEKLGIRGVLSKPVPPRVLTSAVESARSGRHVEDVETVLIGARTSSPPGDV